MGSLFFLVLGVSLAVSAPSEVPAANLARNGSFDANLNDWKVSPDDPNSETGAMSWTSGTLELATSATADRNAFRVGQCVTLSTNADNFVFGGRIRVPVDQRVRGLAGLEIERFVSTDCSGKPAPYAGLGGVTNADFWSSRRELVARAEALSVRLVAYVSKYYEWNAADEIGESDDDQAFRAFFDDLYVAAVEGDAPAERPPIEAPASRFKASAAPRRMLRWGTRQVAPPTMTIAVLGRDGKPHKTGVVAECSSLEELPVQITLKTPYGENDPRSYPIQPVSLAGDGRLGPRPSVEIGFFKAGDRTRKLIPIVCHGDAPAAVRVIGEKGERIAALREAYDCFRGALDEEKRKEMAERLSDEDMIKWPLSGWVVANPAGEYEIVARYVARESGFWHEPVLSNTVKVKILRTAPCAPKS